ncbi:hypothetical protein Q7P36_005600 [Cladosporium allicinum]
MVQSNYTVSSVQQLLGAMPPVRISGSKSKSTTSKSTTDKHLKVTDSTNRAPAPTRPLPPIPQQELRMRASRSSEVLPFADRMKLRPDANVPAAVGEDEVLVMPATVDTPPTIKDQDDPLDRTPVHLGRSVFVPVLETPRKIQKLPTIEKRISQYYEYITPPISLGLGRTGSRRDRKASHTPTSSGGSDIYFSPIDANKSSAFLSSPQPSPPDSPSENTLNGNVIRDGRMGEVAKKIATLVVETAPVKQPEMAEIAGIGRTLDNRKMTLTLAHVDRVTTALALAPLVQKSVRGSYFDDETAEASDEPVALDSSPTDLPTPPPSESSVTEITTTPQEFGGIALIDTNIEGAPVSLASTDAFDIGKCTHLSLPSGLSASSTLRVERPSFAGAESKIILRSLFTTLDRKTSERALTLVAETDVTTSFARAALTELAHAQSLTLDDIEIATPTAGGTIYSLDESIDWCRVGEGKETDLIITSPVTDVLDGSMARISALSAESCTMQTLTLISELARLQKTHATFLVLQPTRHDSNGELAGVKIPFVSEDLRQRFVLMSKAKPSASASDGPSSSTTSIASTASTSTRGGARGRQFREAVIATVAPSFVHEEEFEEFVVLEGGRIRVRARCVPLSDGRKIEKWVCFLGGEYDVPY